jgi:2-keto-3-deoxy-galactonokinase
MFVHMNGYISATTLSNEDMARGEAVRWIGSSRSARSMIALPEGHSPSVVHRGPSVSEATLTRSEWPGQRA